MKTLKAGLVFCAVMMSGLVANSVEAAVRVAIVDFQRALNSVEEGKKVMGELDAEKKKRGSSLEKLETELKTLEGKLQEFQRNASTGMMAPDAMAEGRKTQQEFQEKFEKYQQQLQEAEQSLQMKELEARRSIIGKLRAVVQEMGRSEPENTIIFEANESGLLYSASYTDLTEKVIQEYNKRHKAGSKKK